MEEKQLAKLTPKQKDLYFLISEINRKKTIVLAGSLTEYDYFIHKQAELYYKAGASSEVIKDIIESRFVYIGGAHEVFKLRGIRYGIEGLKIFGTFWDRQDARFLYAMVLEALM